MNNKIKIGVVEDEPMMAELIRFTLGNFGYLTTEPACDFEKAVKMIETDKPDIILIDIYLDGKKDGIDLAEVINSKYKIPFILLTSHTSKEILERAKKVNPPAYLVKPFNNDELYCAIEICLNNFIKPLNPPEKTSNYILNDTFFIKNGYYFNKVKIDEIYYIESDHVYINVYTKSKKLTIRASLNTFIQSLNKDVFFRIHRSYAVNVNHIESINTDNVVVNGVKVPATKQYRNEILKKLHVI